MGFDAVASEASSPKFGGMVLAADVSAKTEKEIRFLAEKYGKEVVKAGFSMDEAQHYFQKRVGVFLIADEGLFGTVKRHITDSTEN